jgi:hypothetical protein
MLPSWLGVEDSLMSSGDGMLRECKLALSPRRRLMG